MKRFRVTIIAVCIILGWLAYTDLTLYLRNPEPLKISIAELEANGAPREWLQIDDGVQNLLQAINMSGTMEITSFLVPLKQSKDDPKETRVWVETRDPKILGLLKTYYFLLNTEEEREKFVKENAGSFFEKRQYIGLTADSLVAESNQKKLTELLQSMNIPVSQNTIFISEGKKPFLWRGVFFAIISVAGLFRVGMTLIKKDA
jgi:hypothetical protein